MKRKNVVLINIICSILQQLVVTICGFILPRLIIHYLGSEVNGLISSLNQFLSYISLVEGGLTGVIAANVYKPLVENDMDMLGKIVKTAESFYRKIAFIYILYTCIIAALYPIITRSTFSFWYIFILTLILSGNLLVQYLFSITWKTLLVADKKGYIVSCAYIIVVVVNTLMSALLIKIYPNVHLVKLISSVIYLIQPIIYNHYVKKHYKINYNDDKDTKLLSQRWDGFAINIAAFVHNNTDIVILTIASSLLNVSVYSVYLMIVNGIKNIVMAISQAIAPTIGLAYAKKEKNILDDAFDMYEFIIVGIAFFLFTVGGVSITPFVNIYMSGVTDANYNQPLFAWMMILAELVYCVREPYLMMAYSANRFKDLKIIAYIEASINIVVSLVLVKKFGLIGVAVGTLIAMIVRTAYQMLYLKNHILHRSVFKLIKASIIFGVSMLVVILLLHYLIDKSIYSIQSWILNLIRIMIVTIIIFSVSIVVFYRPMVKKMLIKIRGKL